MVEDRQAFVDWAVERYGESELREWLAEQDDPHEAWTELAEDYLAGDDEEGDEDDEPTEGDLAFNEWLVGTIGEEGIAQLSQLSGAEYQEAVEDLVEAFYDERREFAGGE